jgi:hypothetical protein
MLQSIAAKAPPELLREDDTLYGLILVPSQRAGEAGPLFISSVFFA